MTEHFYKLPKNFAAIPQRQMPATAKIVMAILADRIGHNETCWPGVRSIAADSGLTVETVIQSINSLEAAGLVTVDRRGSGKVNHYSISQSAQGIRAPKKLERPRNPNTGAQASSAQAPKKLELNQTDQLNQTHSTAVRAAGKMRVVWSETESRFIMPPELLATWQRDYPGLDVEQETRKAGQWHAANRRWKSAYQSALVRWLNRAADSAGKKPARASTFTPAETDGTDLNSLAQKFPTDEERKSHGD